MALLPDELDRKMVYRLLSDDSTFATVLHTIALVSYGQEIYQVEPMEIVMRLRDDYGVEMTDDNESKLNAILLATSTDAFYTDPEAFTGICNTLAEGDPGLDIFNDLTLAEIMWGMYEVELNHGEGEMTPGVQRVIDQVMAEETDDPEQTQDPTTYLQAYLQEGWEQLRGQLADLGVKEAPLPPVWPGTPALVQ